MTPISKCVVVLSIPKTLMVIYGFPSLLEGRDIFEGEHKNFNQQRGRTKGYGNMDFIKKKG